MTTMGTGWTSRIAAVLVTLMAGVGLAPITAVGPAAAGTSVPGAPNCPMFPSDDVRNADISGLPVDAHSAAWLAGIGSPTTHLHPDFGP